MASVLALCGLISGAIAQQTAATVRVNCGGKRADVWLRDRGCTNGTTLKTAAAITKAKFAPQAIYQSCRQASPLSYSFPEVPAGSYIVRLHFAELVYSAAGARVFHIKIEGVKATTNLDVFVRAGGMNRALRLAYLVTVVDGNGLQIQAVRKKGGSPFINGIEIIPLPPPEDLRLIPGGSNSGTNPLHMDELNTPNYPQFYNLTTGPFYMGLAEVAKGQWDEVRSWAATNGYTDLPEGVARGPDHPVQSVDWFDCVKWCNARSQMEGRTPAYYTNTAKTAICKTGTGFDIPSNCVNWVSGYRLPTATEWEYAARGGLNGKRYPWGDTITHSNANYFSVDNFPSDQSPTRGYHPLFTIDETPYTGAIGSLEPNGFGLYDMAGNVNEWCWTRHPNGSPFQRTARGGDWAENSLFCRVGYLPLFDAVSRLDTIGFRVVLPLGP